MHGWRVSEPPDRAYFARIYPPIILKRPDSYKEIFKNLKENHILSEEVAKKMMELASFRNRLVHLYWEVTKEEVLEKAEDLKIFEDYINEVINYLKKSQFI